MIRREHVVKAARPKLDTGQSEEPRSVVSGIALVKAWDCEPVMLANTRNSVKLSTTVTLSIKCSVEHWYTTVCRSPVRVNQEDGNPLRQCGGGGGETT